MDENKLRRSLFAQVNRLKRENESLKLQLANYKSETEKPKLAGANAKGLDVEMG